MLRMLRSLRWTTEKWPSRGPSVSCRMLNIFPSLDRATANSLALLKFVLKEQLADVVEGMEFWLGVALGICTMRTPLSATLQIMHKFFNLWRIAHASEDLRNIEDTKIAAFLQLWAAVSRGGVVFFQPF